MADLDDDVSARITIRIDREMREAITEMRKDYHERTGTILEDARLIRMMLRRALGSDMDRAAVAESLTLMYRLNQLMVRELIQAMEKNSAALLAEAKSDTEE